MARIRDAGTEGDPFSQGGEMGARIREFDWASTSVGPMAEWPLSLRTLVHMLVSSRHPMFLWWGPDLVQFYNDGYRPSLGEDRHPGALGAQGEPFWADIWEVIGPDVRQVMETGEATWYENRLVPIERNGRTEEVYWTYSYSPVLEDGGDIGGTLVTVQETTAGVISQRRMSVLRALADRTATETHTVEEVCQVAGEVLDQADLDLAFWALHLVDESGRPALVGASAGLLTGGDEREAVAGSSAWPVDAVASSGQPRLVEDVAERFGRLPGGGWDEPPRSAFVVPVASARSGESLGVLVAGISPRLGFDNEYRRFLELAAGQIAGAIRNARERAEGERLEARARERLELAMEQAPAALCLLRGPEHIFTLANPRYREIIGGRPAIGRSVAEAVPEAIGQGFIALLDEVYESGESHVGREVPLTLQHEGQAEASTRYLDFVYAPIRDVAGVVDGIFVHAYDVTPQVEARLAAEEAARARDDFLTIASHELRNPVAAIVGTAQMLGRRRDAGDLTPARLDGYLENLLRSSGQLARLTDDLLDLSRLQRGNVPLRAEATDVAALVRMVVENEHWADRGIHLESPEHLEATVDADRLTQVVENLINNAAKYSAPVEPIAVLLREDGDGFQVDVRDRGIGLPPDALEQIFDPFGRAANASASGIEGLGLGLSIARRIAEQHGGRLWAESEGEGRGTTMHLWLPATPPDGDG